MVRRILEPALPGQISDQHVTAEPLADGLLELEGQQLRAIELGHTDTDGTSALHVPSTGLVVAGDAVYGDVHLYLGEAKGNGTRQWLGALDTIEQLQPSAVVAGHKRDGDADSPDSIGKTRRYIEDFTSSGWRGRTPNGATEGSTASWRQGSEGSGIDGVGNPEECRNRPRATADRTYLVAVPALSGRGDPRVKGRPQRPSTGRPGRIRRGVAGRTADGSCSIRSLDAHGLIRFRGPTVTSW